MWSHLYKWLDDRTQLDGIWRFPIMKWIQWPHLNTGHQKSSHSNCHQLDKCHVTWHPLLFHSDEESRRCLNTYSPTRKSMAIKDYSVDVRDARKQVMHYGDVIMGTIASQITSLTTVYSTVYSGADQRKHQRSASLAFVRRIHRGPVNSPHKWPVTRKMFPFDDVIMDYMGRVDEGTVSAVQHGYVIPRWFLLIYSQQTFHTTDISGIVCL